MLPAVTFRGLSPSPTIVDMVFRRAQKLGAIAPQLEGCHVIIEVSSRGRTRHLEYRVAVHLTGGTDASRRVPRHAEHPNVSVAVRNAFEAARRQLETRGAHSRGLALPIEAFH